MVERTGTARRGASVPIDGDPPAGRRRYRRRPGAQRRSHSGDAIPFRGGPSCCASAGYWRRRVHWRSPKASVTYKERFPGPLALVFAGEPHDPIPSHPDIVELGVVDAATKQALLTHATTLVSPSPNESLALVVLEAWSAGTPVIVNGAAPVTRDHCVRSGGGLWFDDYAIVRGRAHAHHHRQCARPMPWARRAGLRAWAILVAVGRRAIPVVPGACVRAAVRR